MAGWQSKVSLDEDNGLNAAVEKDRIALLPCVYRVQELARRVFCAKDDSTIENWFYPTNHIEHGTKCSVVNAPFLQIPRNQKQSRRVLSEQLGTHF